MFKAVVAALLGGLVAAGHVQAAGRTAQPELVLHVYDAFGLVPADLQRARETVDDIFNKAGIHVVWLDCGEKAAGTPACDHAVSAGEAVVRIVPSRSSDTSPTLGYSVVDGRGNSGCIATVLADRVGDRARRLQIDAGTLLGRVIVHEVSHVLLGTLSHSSLGLMRAVWSDEELRRDWHLDWLLSRQDAHEVRLGLRASGSESDHPGASPRN